MVLLRFHHNLPSNKGGDLIYFMLFLSLMLLIILSSSAILIYYFRKRISIRKYVKAKKKKIAIDILGAWGTKKQIKEIYTKHTPKIGKYLAPLDFIMRLIFFPVTSIIIVAIIIYQISISREKMFHRKIYIEQRPYRYCPFYPGCSNFAIGALLRYNIITASYLCSKRFRSCNGSNKGIDIP